MEKVMRIECPAELLLGLHVNVERLAEMVKLEAERLQRQAGGCAGAEARDVRRKEGRQPARWRIQKPMRHLPAVQRQGNVSRFLTTPQSPQTTRHWP